jgi:hypothetical protein
LLTKERNGEILSTGFCGSHFTEEPEPIFADAYRLSRIRADAAKIVQNFANSTGQTAS